MKKNKGGINMKFGKKAFGLIAATMALGIGTTQVFAATLTAEQAKNIASQYVPAGSVHLATEQDWNKYEIKMFNESTGTFYEIDINKTTQQPISFDSEARYSYGSTQVTLSVEDAKNVVLKEIPDAQFITAYLEWDDGLQEYKVTFYNSKITGEYKINPQSGAVLDRDIKFTSNMAVQQSNVQTTVPAQTAVTTPAPAAVTPVVTAPTISTPQGAAISIERAKQIAQSKAPGATLWKIHPDYEHGRLVYEVELRNGYIEYSMDIDATTGAIYDYEVDYDD